MQNNSNNSNTGWRQRLDEFEDVSGNNLELNAAWEKLQQKKSHQQTSSSRKWYWLAAACFTGLLIVFASLLNNETDPTAQPVLVQSNATKNEVEQSKIIENTPDTIEKNKEQSITTKIKASKPVAFIERNQSTDPLLVVQEDNAPIQTITLIDTIAKQPLPVMAVTKKLKLVHINEINQPQQGIAKEEGKPYFPITYQTKQVYTNHSPTTKKDKDNIIRIKLN